MSGCPTCDPKYTELLDSETVDQGRTVNVAWHDQVEWVGGVIPSKILADAEHGLSVSGDDDGKLLARIPLPTLPQTRLNLARLIAGEGWSVVPSESATNAAAMQEDLSRILDALGLGDHARPYSPHECVTRDVLPAIERMTAANARHVQEIGRLRDRNQQLYSHTAQPDRPEPVDPASVKVGDIVDYETTVEYRLCRIMGEVEDVAEHVTGEDGWSLKIHGHWWGCNIATVRILQRPEPEPDEAAVEALAKRLYAAKAERIGLNRDWSEIGSADQLRHRTEALTLIRDHGVEVPNG